MAETSTESKIAGREPVTLSRHDAEERDIAHGDLVRIWNDRGETHAGASISDDVLPGIALLSTGAWYTSGAPERPGSSELRGNPNVLTRDTPTSRLTPRNRSLCRSSAHPPTSRTTTHTACQTSSNEPPRLANWRADLDQIAHGASDPDISDDAIHHLDELHAGFDTGNTKPW